MSKPEKHYLVVIRFGGEEPIIRRLQESFPTIERLMNILSDGRFQQAFRSHDGDTFAFALESRHNAQLICSQIHAPGGKDRKGHEWPSLPSPIQTRDKVIVLELGDNHFDYNNNVLTGWLERNN